MLGASRSRRLPFWQKHIETLEWRNGTRCIRNTVSPVTKGTPRPITWRRCAGMGLRRSIGIPSRRFATQVAGRRGPSKSRSFRTPLRPELHELANPHFSWHRLATEAGPGSAGILRLFGLSIEKRRLDATANTFLPRARPVRFAVRHVFAAEFPDY